MSFKFLHGAFTLIRIHSANIHPNYCEGSYTYKTLTLTEFCCVVSRTTLNMYTLISLKTFGLIKTIDFFILKKKHIIVVCYKYNGYYYITL